jgi:uncharacterized protein (TIGR03067 family)
VPHESDYGRLQGTWGATSQIVDGVTSERNWKTNVLDYMVLEHSIDILGGAEVDHAKYRLDASRNPKTIDIRQENGKIERGIYEIQGESLVVCSASSIQSKVT